MTEIEWTDARRRATELQSRPLKEGDYRAEANHYREIAQHWQDSWCDMHTTAVRLAGERDRAIDRLVAVEKVVRELEANMHADVGKACAVALRVAVDGMP